MLACPTINDKLQERQCCRPSSILSINKGVETNIYNRNEILTPYTLPITQVLSWMRSRGVVDNLSWMRQDNAVCFLPRVLSAPRFCRLSPGLQSMEGNVCFSPCPQATDGSIDDYLTMSTSFDDGIAQDSTDQLTWT